MEKSEAVRAYESALRMTEKTSRTVWSVYPSLLATNALCLSWISLFEKRSGFIVFGAVSGLVICVAWALITSRNYGYYRYYFACAREMEAKAFDNQFRMIRDGANFGSGNAVTVGEQGVQRLNWFGRLFRVAWLIYVVIGFFLAGYAYQLLQEIARA